MGRSLTCRRDRRGEGGEHQKESEAWRGRRERAAAKRAGGGSGGEGGRRSIINGRTGEEAEISLRSISPGKGSPEARTDGRPALAQRGFSSLFHRRADDPRSRSGSSQIPFPSAAPSVPPSRIWAVSFTCFPLGTRWPTTLAQWLHSHRKPSASCNRNSLALHPLRPTLTALVEHHSPISQKHQHAQHHHRHYQH